MGKGNLIKNLWTIIRTKADNFDINWVGGGNEDYQPTLSKSILWSIIAAFAVFALFVLLISTKPEMFPGNTADLYSIISLLVADLGILIYQFVINKYKITATGANVVRWFICHGISIFLFGYIVVTLGFYVIMIWIALVVLNLFIKLTIK